MAKQDSKEVRQKIIDNLDIPAEFVAIGLTLKGAVRASGKQAAYALFREDSNASAWIDVNTGMYGDSGSSDKAMSIFDVAVKLGKFPNFNESFRHYAKVAGVELGKAKSRKNLSPDDQIEWERWMEGNDTIAQLWCIRRKPGVTLEALKDAGARIGYYPCWYDAEGKRHRGKNKVIALPCYSHPFPEPETSPAPDPTRPAENSEPEPVAWVIWHAFNPTLEIYRGKDKTPDHVKMQSVGPTAGTLMGARGLRRLTHDRDKIEAVWKTAGPTDMLALMAAIPEDERDSHVVICNASGETGDVAQWNAEVLLNLPVNIVHDADKAGEFGAKKWGIYLAGACSATRIVPLPYQPTEKNGQDLRDFFAGTNTFADLKKIASETQPLSHDPAAPTTSPAPATPGSDDPAAPVNPSDQYALDRAMVSLVQLDVLGQTEKGGIKVFSTHHRKSEIIPSIGNMKYEDLIRIAGPPVRQFVSIVSGDVKPGMVALPDIRNAIAMLGGCKVIGEQTEIGTGAWQGMDTDGTNHPSVVLVGSGEAAEFNGTMKLEKITHPRCKGHLLDFDSGGESWYDYPALARLVDGCTPIFAQTAVNDAINLFETFSWKHPASAVTTAGLVLATWVQTLWEWRPQVAIVGPSQAGKTTLFKALEKMFGKLTVMSSGSTAAGIRQAIRASAKVVLCDEFESSRHRTEVLEMLRVSGRGDKILRGTTNQRGQGFGLQHICWVAAIEVGLKRAPDRNRFIMLELTKPPGKRETFKLPSHDSLLDLGQRLLAVAIRYALKAKPLAVILKDQHVDGIDNRIVESYAVPAAILAAVQGFGEPEAVELLHEMLKGVDTDDGPTMDETELMNAILSAVTHTGRENATIGQLIERVLSQDTDMELAAEHMAKCGMRFAGDPSEDKRVLSGHGSIDPNKAKWFLMAPGPITQQLLGNTDWKYQSIDQILKRIPGAVAVQRRIGGVKIRCTAIPRGFLESEYLGRSTQQEPAGF